jgi:hypothetical protein
VRRVVAGIALATLLGACSASTESEEPDRPGSPPAVAGSTAVAPDAASPTPAPVEAGGARSARTRFAGRISTISAGLEREMVGATWRPGCPVPISGLRLLRFNHVGFDGQVKRGRMVVNADVAQEVLWVFRQLFEARFPMKRVDLAREFDESRWEEQPHSRRSVTASFNCRVVVTPDGPGTTFSQHAFGLAIDVNPLQNPYVRSDGWVRNRFARPYIDRSEDLPGMIHDGDVVVRSFAAIGWSWGGRWSGGKDYMHFSRAGR